MALDPLASRYLGERPAVVTDALEQRARDLGRPDARDLWGGPYECNDRKMEEGVS
jgi:hypothetical protein